MNSNSSRNNYIYTYKSNSIYFSTPFLNDLIYHFYYKNNGFAIRSKRKKVELNKSDFIIGTRGINQEFGYGNINLLVTKSIFRKDFWLDKNVEFKNSIEFPLFRIKEFPLLSDIRDIGIYFRTKNKNMDFLGYNKIGFSIANL